MLMTTKSLQTFNANVVLKTIREGGFISRTEIARKLGCSKSVISSIITELEECGLIREVGIREAAKAGRKSHILTFEAGAVAFLSAHVRKSRATVGLVDLAGRVITKDEITLADGSPTAVAERLGTRMTEILEAAPIPQSRIESAGIMCPGFIDWENGQVIKSTLTLGWDQPVALASLVSEKLGKPVTVENDANAIALAESWIGAAEQYSRFVLLYIGKGVGGAYIHDNRLLHGEDNRMAEFGKYPAPGEPETWVEDRMGLKAIADECGLAGEDDERLAQAADLLFSEEAEAPHPLRRRFIDGLSYIACSVYASFAPQAVVVHCPYRPVPEALLGEISAAVSRYLGDRHPGRRRIVNSRLNDGRSFIGGAANAISRSRFAFVLSTVN